MTTLTYSREELLSEHDYSAEHVVAGRRMHGGMSADGTYQPPRSLGRVAALAAWTEALLAHGGELFDAHSSLLDGERTPTVTQSQVLLRHGLGETFWNSLTITGKIEARGRLLAEVAFPDLQPYIVDDISEMAIGHLNRGLLYAHGIDEGGQPDIGIGGHDEMWFAARDLAFGPDAYADVKSIPVVKVSRLPPAAASTAAGGVAGGCAGVVTGPVWAAADVDSTAANPSALNAPVTLVIMVMLLLAVVRSRRWTSRLR